MSRYYTKIFTNWFDYSEWIETTYDTIVSILCGNTDRILVTVERNRKLNEEI